MDKTEVSIVTVLVCIILVGVASVTHVTTRENMEKEAVANGAGHWTIVAGEAAFAWGPADE